MSFIFRALFSKTLWLKHWLGEYQWFRRCYGGRWEYHWIDICGGAMWLEMRPEKKWQWPEYRQPCSVGEPIVEDWPLPAVRRKL